MKRPGRLETLEYRLCLAVVVSIDDGDLVVEAVEGEAAGEVVIEGSEGGILQVSVDRR